MHKIGINFDLLAHGMERGGGGAQRRFAVLDIQTLISRGFIWLAFGDRMDETKRDVAAVASVTAPFAALMAAWEPSIPTMIRSGDCGWFIASSDRKLD